MFNYIKSWFIKELDVLLNDFSELGSRLEALAVLEGNKAIEFAKNYEASKAKSIKASKVAQNIKTLIGDI